MLLTKTGKNTDLTRRQILHTHTETINLTQIFEEGMVVVVTTESQTTPKHTVEVKENVVKAIQDFLHAIACQ